MEQRSRTEHACMHIYRYTDYMQTMIEVGPHLLIQIFDKARHSAASHAIRWQSK